jgi:hypothetical protein
MDHETKCLMDVQTDCMHKMLDRIEYLEEAVALQIQINESLMRRIELNEEAGMLQVSINQSLMDSVKELENFPLPKPPA